jgi:hypothetical protein
VESESIWQNGRMAEAKCIIVSIFGSSQTMFLPNSFDHLQASDVKNASILHTT